MAIGFAELGVYNFSRKPHRDPSRCRQPVTTGAADRRRRSGRARRRQEWARSCRQGGGDGGRSHDATSGSSSRLPLRITNSVAPPPPTASRLSNADRGGALRRPLPAQSISILVASTLLLA
jgi:hypothetical protein